MDKEIDKIKIRIEFYEKAEVPVHIVTESDEWINGYILAFYDDYVCILDRVEGKKDIFYVDIRRLAPFTGDYATLKKKDIYVFGEKKEDKKGY